MKKESKKKREEQATERKEMDVKWMKREKGKRRPGREQ